MGRQSFIPGDGMFNEDGEIQFFVPGDGMFNETTPTGAVSPADMTVNIEMTQPVVTAKGGVSKYSMMLVF